MFTPQGADESPVFLVAFRGQLGCGTPTQYSGPVDRASWRDNAHELYEQRVSDGMVFLHTGEIWDDPEWRMRQHFPNVQKVSSDGICVDGALPSCPRISDTSSSCKPARWSMKLQYFPRLPISLTDAEDLELLRLRLGRRVSPLIQYGDIPGLEPPVNLLGPVYRLPLVDSERDSTFPGYPGGGASENTTGRSPDVATPSRWAEESLGG